MKQVLLFFTLIVWGNALFAQKNLRITQKSGQSAPAAFTKGKKMLTGFELPSGTVSIPPADDRFFESTLGSTLYDNQTNNSMPKRIHNWGDGKVSAAWMLSQQPEGDPLGYSDRGTGYNTNASGNFLPPVTTRVEAVRTGFPSYFVTPNGEEWIVSHVSLTASSNAVHFAHKAQSATTWTEGTVPTTTPNGGLWVRGCAGGPDGNTIHILYLTTPVANGGAAVDGLTGQIKYCRSTDGGQSWDKIDVSLPGITSDKFVGFGAEEYVIDATGNTVAIGIFSLFTDALMIKSSDNGDTWDLPRIVNDIPLEKYKIDDDYTFDDIASAFDPDIAPTPNGVIDSMAFLTTDATGAVMVDNDELVHIFYSPLFVNDADETQDPNIYQYYPGYNLGIVYWNELMDDNAGVVAAFSPDINEDGALGSPDNPNPTVYAEGYGEAFCTGPSAGIDADGRLYVTFITPHELFFDQDGNFYRQPFIANSGIGDWEHWNIAKPVLDSLLVEDYVSTAFTECYFASMAKKVDENAHVIWQEDFVLGITFRITGNQVAPANNIRYLAYPVALLSGANEQPDMIRDIAVVPNPASKQTQVRFDLQRSGNLVLELFSVSGQRMQVHHKNAPSGPGSFDLNTAGLDNGLYFVRLGTESGAAMVKLTVAK